MNEQTPRMLREAALEKLNVLMAASPADTEVRFNRASILAELGRKEEAKAAYLELLAQAPTHFGALNNLGNLLYAMGFKSAAKTAYLQAIAHHPTNPKAHVNLANVLAMNHETQLAMEHFETALRLDPEHLEANRGLAYLLTELRDEERAVLYREKGFKNRPVLTLPYCGDGEPIRLLLLLSASGGVIPMNHHLDENIFQATVLFVEFYDLSNPLPPHDIVFNTIGDADLCQPALEVAAKIVETTNAPVLNHPLRIMPTGRIENAKQLAHIKDVITPRMLLLPREFLEKGDAALRLAEKGFNFPLLLRAPGFHTGRFFVRVQNSQELIDCLPNLPGQELIVIQYLDAKSRDGKIRKYRVMMIGGVLYPVHAAISDEWKIHYFTAQMADNPDHRAEDAAFLENMPKVLGPRAMVALEEISNTMKLDYGGMDFSLSESGEVLLFEANATMVIYPPDKDAKWDYRRPAVQRILDAIRRLLTPHA